MATTSFQGGGYSGRPYGSFAGKESSAEPATVVTTTQPSGVRNRHRRWGLKRKDRTYYFEDLRALQKFAAATAEAEPDTPKRKARPRIIIPVETVRDAREAGYSGLQKLADRLEYDALIRIQDRIYGEPEDEDYADFIEFLKVI